MGTRWLHRILAGGIALGLALAAGPAQAQDRAVTDTQVVGEWSGSALQLSVDADGRFDWSIGDRVTDGTWTRGARMLSLATDQWKRVYAYRVEGDTLTLFDIDGTELVMQRAQKRTRRKARSL